MVRAVVLGQGWMRTIPLTQCSSQPRKRDVKAQGVHAKEAPRQTRLTHETLKLTEKYPTECASRTSIDMYDGLCVGVYGGWFHQEQCGFAESDSSNTRQRLVNCLAIQEHLELQDASSKLDLLDAFLPLEELRMKPADVIHLVLEADKNPDGFVKKLMALHTFLPDVNVVDVVGRCPEIFTKLSPGTFGYSHINDQIQRSLDLFPEVPSREIYNFLAQVPDVLLLGKSLLLARQTCCQVVSTNVIASSSHAADEFLFGKVVDEVRMFLGPEASNLKVLRWISRHPFFVHLSAAGYLQEHCCDLPGRGTYSLKQIRRVIERNRNRLNRDGCGFYACEEMCTLMGQRTLAAQLIDQLF